MRTPRGLRPLVAALLCAVLLAGCTPGRFPGEAPSSPAPLGAPHLAAAIERIAPRVDELLGETGVPGLSIAVVHGGEVVAAEGFGVASLDTGAAVDIDTVFQLASVSKPIGASVIAEAATRAGFDWDTRVATALPGFALADPWVTEHLTIGDLYSHRSGLPGHAGDDLASLGVDRDTILERLRLLPLEPFRASYAYTNLGIMAGALAVTAAAGATDWATLSERLVYAPLGMERTTSRYADYLAMPNHAVGHTNWSGTWIVHPDPLDDDLATAAGGVASSASDLGRWLVHVLDAARDRGPGTALLRAAMRPVVVMPAEPIDPSAAANAYGYGFQIGRFGASGLTLVSHSGAFAQGAGTIIAMLPGIGLGVAVLTNGLPVGLAEAVAMETLDWAVHGELTREWWSLYRDAMAPALKASASIVAGPPQEGAPGPAMLDRYVGMYRSDYFGPATVTRTDTGLELRITPTSGTGQRWALEPWGPDTFRVRLDNEDAAPDSVSAVRIDPRAGTLWFEYFDHSSGGAGTFTRTGP